MMTTPDVWRPQLVAGTETEAWTSVGDVSPALYSSSSSSINDVEDTDMIFSQSFTKFNAKQCRLNKTAALPLSSNPGGYQTRDTARVWANVHKTALRATN